MTPTDYIVAADTTTPPALHHGSIPTFLVANGLQGCADAAVELDAVKKALVYGPKNRPLPNDGPLWTNGYTHDHPTDPHQMPAEVLHGVIGLITEAGELAELALTNVVGRDAPFDRQNLREELGDQCWYIARILKAMQGAHPDEDWTFERIMAENIAKLAARHKSQPGQNFNPNAGSEEGRNRDAEREAMDRAG